MDIMNELPRGKFELVDDLLAFVSIYDDEERTKSYFRMLEENAHLLRGKVCVEVGCGFGLLSEKLAKLGARKVYAVEQNSSLYEIAKSRLAQYENVSLILSDIRDFYPNESVDVLVHELFGQLLYDEDIYSLNQLHFVPKHFLPNKAVLKYSILNSKDYIDTTVTPFVLQKLKGVLVSGLFEDEDISLDYPLLQWLPNNGERSARADISPLQGDLLCFGLEIYHDSRRICRAGLCDNWSLVWTPRDGNLFNIQFEQEKRGTRVLFSWE